MSNLEGESVFIIGEQAKDYGSQSAIKKEITLPIRLVAEEAQAGQAGEGLSKRVVSDPLFLSLERLENLVSRPFVLIRLFAKPLQNKRFRGGQFIFRNAGFRRVGGFD